MIAATVSDGEIAAREHPDPRPGAGDVLVAVRAAGINNADLLQRLDRYPPQLGPPPEIPGNEVAGEVVELGQACTRFAVGDRVMGLGYGCAQAQLAVVPERLLMPVPEGLDWAGAGGFPEAFTTAHEALFTACGLGSGERLLVHGGAGGVGTAAVQLAVMAG
ncbi:MAG: alcohol dehydrogenase catalytic domain-containing protein, partial [Solirubrobacteraceae bacterium]